MNKAQSERRLAENEVVFRQLNEQVLKGVKETNQMAVEDDQPEYIITSKPSDPPLYFCCECSDENCTKRVKINLYEYNKIHKHRDQFIVLRGHEVGEVERLLREEAEFNVVEKYNTPPEKVDSLQATDLDNT